MKNPLTWLSRRRFPYEPLIKIELSRSALLSNLAEFRKIAPQPPETSTGKIAPVLKSNAYGHGLFEIAEILDKENSRSGRNPENRAMPFFVVDSYFEAVALTAHGIKTPLLIIGYTRPETVLRSSLPNTVFTVTNSEMLEGIKKTKRRVRFHLKIDTGMHRQGISLDKTDEAITLILSNSHLKLEGICSHLPDADNVDTTFTDKQIALWNMIVAKFRKAFPNLKHVHLSATDGHRFSPQISATVSRLGIGLYGLSENESLMPFAKTRPVLEMKTIITGTKRLSAGDLVGYNNTFRAKEPMTVATVPVGYFEGLDRRLSSGENGEPRGYMLVGEGRIPCPIIGKVSMNITTLDISGLPDAKAGTIVVAISGNTSDRNSISAIARTCETITYEIAVKITPHLKRIVS